MHNYVCFGTGYGTGTAPVYGCKICRHIPNWKLFFAVRGGIMNTKCIVISKIQGAQIGWNHRTVYALPSESEEFVSG